MSIPNDDTGDALRRLEASGDDLTQARNVDFTVVFPEKRNAEKFAELFSDREDVASVMRSETCEASPWEVLVVRLMTPSHNAITSFEAELKQMAAPLGGRNDGWGCFTHPMAAES